MLAPVRIIGGSSAASVMVSINVFVFSAQRRAARDHSRRAPAHAVPIAVMPPTATAAGPMSIAIPVAGPPSHQTRKTGGHCLQDRLVIASNHQIDTRSVVPRREVDDHETCRRPHSPLGATRYVAQFAMKSGRLADLQCDTRDDVVGQLGRQRA